jgi:hypothetical protein
VEGVFDDDLQSEDGGHAISSSLLVSSSAEMEPGVWGKSWGMDTTSHTGGVLGSSLAKVISELGYSDGHIEILVNYI